MQIVCVHTVSLFVMECDKVIIFIICASKLVGTEEKSKAPQPNLLNVTQYDLPLYRYIRKLTTVQTAEVKYKPNKYIWKQLKKF